MTPLIRSALTVLFATLALAAAAQDRPQTILVLDGSGSMWGQIEGVAKITIAQQVTEDLLQTLPPEQELGLMAYGHRRRGDCADIELLVPPGPGTREAIAEAVRRITPRGRTPMTDSVIAAAEALRYAEEKATVILVSDGIETCHPDPCAAARVLEETGTDFTAHVVGFDVAEDPEALAQLQCLAENTGGRFLTASNAVELSQALTAVVVEEAEPEPQPVEVTIYATVGRHGPEIWTDLIWEIVPVGAAPGAPEVAPRVTAQLMPGMYRVAATRPEDELTMEAEFEAYTSGQTVVLVFPEIVPAASVQAPASAPMGATIQVGWTGPGGEDDYIAVAEAGADDGDYLRYVYTREGSPLELLMPPRPGPYELRYVDNTLDRVLARETIELTPVTATIEAPVEAAAGSEIEIGWTGPDYHNDYVSIAEVGADDGDYERYAYVRGESPVELLVPSEPGDYELRYVINQDATVIARRSITLTAIGATVQGPATAPVGSEIEVGWSGPAYHNDYVSIAEAGADDGDYERYTYVRDESPVELLMPAEPGEYELRYVVNQGTVVLARQPIKLTPVTATVAGPATAPVGAEIEVGWTGPAYHNDYVSIAEAGADDGDYVRYAYVRDTSPTELLMPTAPGDYELRYVMNQGAVVLARQAITLTPVMATLDAPALAAAGGEVEVIWEGPAYERDYIALARPGDEDYETYTYVREGNPLEVRIPDAPGAYELRYVLGQDGTAIATRPLTAE